MELVWDGKYDPQGNRREVVVPEGATLTPLEVYAGTGGATEPNSLILGENRLALAALREKYRGKVNLIYLDPPFAVGTDFLFPVTVGADTRPSLEAVAYRDIWGTGAESYLHQMWERFVLLRDLLAEDGTIYVHCDWRMNAPLRLVLDEVFGAGAVAGKNAPGFRCEIAWCYREAINQRSSWNRKHDTLLMYTRSDRWTFNADTVLQPYAETTVRKYRHTDENGKRYRLMGRGIQSSPIRSARDISPEWEKTHPELTFRHYLKPGTLPVDYWHLDIVNQASAERVDYPTQKPEALLERIIRASSHPGDLVLDPYCGSGTTAVVSERLGRRWLAGDVSPWAVQVARKRLLGMAARTAAFAVCAAGKPAETGTVNCRIDRASGTVTLNGIRGNKPFPLPERSAIDYVDFWAVDSAYRLNEPIHPTWFSFRTRKNRALTLVAELNTPLNDPLAVLAVDVWGNRYLHTEDRR
ncbi:MAG: hypothetical protein OHK0029_12970 [Armatimonadaceae bacterium]